MASVYDIHKDIPWYLEKATLEPVFLLIVLRVFYNVLRWVWTIIYMFFAGRDTRLSRADVLGNKHGR